jgi:hypothetical protein
MKLTTAHVPRYQACFLCQRSVDTMRESDADGNVVLPDDPPVFYAGQVGGLKLGDRVKMIPFHRSCFERFEALQAEVAP